MNVTDILADKVLRLSINASEYETFDVVEHADDIPHLTNLVYVIYKWLKYAGYENAAEWVHTFENTIFMMIIVIVISIWAVITYRKTHKSKDVEERRRIPKGFNQNFWEIIIQSLYDFTIQSLGLGKRGRSYVPFIGSLFLFIFLNNIFGMIPLMHASTSSLNTTLGLGIVVFVTVQIHGMRALGLKGWFYHMAGIEPGVTVTYFLWPLFLPIHIVGELIKPISLALRLFGNIFGKEILIAVFVTMGASFFIPFQIPFYFLALLFSFIQALVFTLLACIYIASMSHVHISHS